MTMKKLEWVFKLLHATTGLALAAVVFAKVATSPPSE